MLDLLRRFWFPFALLLVCLLALPGLALFILALTEAEGPLNSWLEDHFRLSYHSPLPWTAGLLLFLLPLAVAALYFLKLKRKSLQVPSTFLWRKSIEDLHVNSFLQWLRENVLLLLQLLFLACCIYALMAFRFHGRSAEGAHFIVMIDNSASMSATDVAPNRLEAAKAEALKEIDAARPGDVGMVIVFNSSAESLQSYTSDREVLRQAVLGIQPTQRPTRVEEALSLADSLANPARSTDNQAVRPLDANPGQDRTYVEAQGTPTEVHLYSDGRFPDVPDFALGNLNLIFHSCGKPGLEHSNNVGIVRLNATRSENDPTQVQVLVRVLNHRPRDTEATVELEAQAVGGNPSIYEQTVKLPAAVEKQEADAPKDAPLVREPGESVLTFDLKDQDEQTEALVHVRLKEPDHSVLGNLGVQAKQSRRWVDDFPLDDEAWLVLGVVRKARVLLVSKGNRFLDDFFQENVIGKLAVIERIRPDDLASEEKYLRHARNGDHDLCIFDLCRPAREEDMPRGNTLFIGMSPPGWQRPGTDKGPNERAITAVPYPPVRGWEARDPIMRDLTALHTIGIIEAFRLEGLPPRTPALIESDQRTGLMVLLSRGAFHDLVMTFALFNDQEESNTNWPLHPSYPLFLRNVLKSLGNLGDAAAEENVQPGGVKALRPDVGIPEITVIDPAGDARKLQRGSRADFTYGATDRVGTYAVAWNDKVERRFAVNLLDPEESDLSPRASVQVGAQAIESGKSRQQPFELWRWLVLAALGVLLLEWIIYNRRVFI